MAITATSTNYTGRVVDLSLYPSIQTPGIPADMQVSKTPKAIAGLSKMAQNYSRLLLTPLGTFYGDPDRGSLLLTKLSSGTVRFPIQAAQVFLIESERVREYIKQNETPDTPADERIGTVNLISFDLSPTVVSFNISITSESGGNVTFLLPVVPNI